MSTPSSATTGVAGRYASALFELADNAKSLDQVAQDLVTFRTMVRKSADLARLIASPVIGRDLQGKAALSGLLANVLEHRAALGAREASMASTGRSHSRCSPASSSRSSLSG